MSLFTDSQFNEILYFACYMLELTDLLCAFQERLTMCDIDTIRQSFSPTEFNRSLVSLIHERETRKEEKKRHKFVKCRTKWRVLVLLTLSLSTYIHTLLASYVDAAAKGEPCAFYRSMLFTTQLSNGPHALTPERDDRGAADLVRCTMSRPKFEFTRIYMFHTRLNLHRCQSI